MLARLGVCAYSTQLASKLLQQSHVKPWLRQRGLLRSLVGPAWLCKGGRKRETGAKGKTHRPACLHGLKGAAICLLLLFMVAGAANEWNLAHTPVTPLHGPVTSLTWRFMQPLCMAFLT